MRDALKVDKKLNHLWLGGNNIGVEGAKHVADALKVNKTLGSNKIGDQGAEQLVDALEYNSTIGKYWPLLE